MRMLLQFQKDASVRHLGLLDLQRTMQRALRRSRIAPDHRRQHARKQHHAEDRVHPITPGSVCA